MLNRKFISSKIKYERLPHIEENSVKENSVKENSVNEMNNYDIDNHSLNYNYLSFFDSCNLNIYDGAVNIWVNKKDLFKYPHDFDINKIDVFSCLYGYCLVSRSKVFNEISSNCCRDISFNKITHDNCHVFCKGNVILAKLSNWKKYLPCTILNINDKIPYGCEKNSHDLSYFGESTFNLVFPCCPDSEIYLAWHNHNTVVKNKSVLSYPKKEFFQELEEVDVVFNDNSSDDDALDDDLDDAALDDAALDALDDDALDALDDDALDALDDVIASVIDNVIASSNNKYTLFGNKSCSDKNNNTPCFFDNDNLIFTGVVDKRVANKEILKFNTYWIKDNTYQSFDKIISKKAVTIAATEFSKNLSNSFLQNVCILENYEMENILKIQETNGNGFKFFKCKAIFNNLEPQEPTFFKFSSNSILINDYLKKKFGITLTGPLCDTAKKYLFNLTNLKI